MEQSIFAKIIEGQIPCHKIYEDEQTFAFLDIHPINPGHTLLVPKIQVDHLWELDDDTYRALMMSAKKLGKHMLTKLDAPRIGLVVAGFDVAHAHLHLVPFYEGLETTMAKPKTDQNSPEDLATMAQKLKLL